MKKASGVEEKHPWGSVNPDAAGIDLGSRVHWVALPSERAAEPVRNFGCCTEDLEAMAKWLKEHHIKTVAMESTGVYWVPVFQVLERSGLKVELVSTKHLRSVPGRKTDIQDCQWIQHLHEKGMLRGSFRPADAICVVRSYVRQRGVLVTEAGRHVQRMQKALEQMNIQLHKVVTDVTGETGLAIIRAIVNGTRDPKVLVELRNYRCRKSPEELARALVGDWREEHLFCLRQELLAYEFLQEQIAACERAALAEWKKLEAKSEPEESPVRKSDKVNPEVQKALMRATGVDLSRLPGLSSSNLQAIIAETGTDMSKWPSAKAFASWATLAPPNNITGGKRMRAKFQPRHRVGQFFRVAAQTLANSKTALGAFYRRMRGRKGPAFANAVTAHKLAKLFYNTLRHGLGYAEKGVDFYEKKYRTSLLNGALRTLRRLGVDLQTTGLLEATLAVS